MSFWSTVKKWIGGNDKQPPKEIPPNPPEPPREPPREPPGNHDREYWLQRVIDRKERIWSDTGRYNPRRSESNADKGVSGHAPSTALLKWAATTNEANLHIMIRSGDLDYSFLYYK